MQITKLLVISVDDHRSCFRHQFKHLGLCPEHAVQVVKEFEMRMSDRGIDGDGRLYHTRQQTHLAEFRNPHFNHSRLMFASKL